MFLRYYFWSISIPPNQPESTRQFNEIHLDKDFCNVLGKWLCSSFGLELGKALWCKLGSKLWKEPSALLRSKLRAVLGTLLGTTLSLRLGNSLESRFGLELSKELGKRLGCKLGLKLGTPLGTEWGEPFWSRLVLSISVHKDSKTRYILRYLNNNVGTIASYPYVDVLKFIQNAENNTNNWNCASSTHFYTNFLELWLDQPFLL